MGFETFADAVTTSAISQAVAFAMDFRTIIGLLAGLGVLGLSFGILRSVFS